MKSLLSALLDRWSVVAVIILLPLAAAGAWSLLSPASSESGTDDPASAEAAAGNQYDIAGIGYAVGDPGAPITVVEFSDFGCPYCRRFAEQTYPSIRREFVRTGRVRWRYVPFVLGSFPNGGAAARAAECAGRQSEDEFWAMHDALYAQQSDWRSSDRPAALFADIADSVGLDGARFERCYTEGAVTARIRTATQVARRLGVRATPTFFVNGQRVEGAIPLHVFRQVLAEEE